MDGGTGSELLFDAEVEPDVDADGLGDESQDPDGGGLGLDWEDDWFDDFDDGDELDEDFTRTRRYGRAADAARCGCSTPTACAAARATLLLAGPEGGTRERVRHAPGNRRTGEGRSPRSSPATCGSGAPAACGCGWTRRRAASVSSGRRRLRTKVVVAYFPRRRRSSC